MPHSRRDRAPWPRRITVLLAPFCVAALALPLHGDDTASRPLTTPLPATGLMSVSSRASAPAPPRLAPDSTLLASHRALRDARAPAMARAALTAALRRERQIARCYGATVANRQIGVVTALLSAEPGEEARLARADHLLGDAPIDLAALDDRAEPSPCQSR